MNNSNGFDMSVEGNLNCENSGSDNTIELNVTTETMQFDNTIGHIEDIIIDPTFKNVRDAFMDQNYFHFEDTDENKFIYMDIFHSYTHLVESHLESELQRKIPGFNMASFVDELHARRNELDGEVFEMLRSFADFMSFKQMMIDYKLAKQSLMCDAFLVVGTSQIPRM